MPALTLAMCGISADARVNPFSSLVMLYISRFDRLLGRIPNYFQLLIQPLWGNRHGRANFLREQGDFELFNHPPKGFDLTQHPG
jgi:hypothetical protein